jgi:hypothetical protein
VWETADRRSTSGYASVKPGIEDLEPRLTSIYVQLNTCTLRGVRGDRIGLWIRYSLVTARVPNSAQTPPVLYQHSDSYVLVRQKKPCRPAHVWNGSPLLVANLSHMCILLRSVTGSVRKSVGAGLVRCETRPFPATHSRGCTQPPLIQGEIPDRGDAVVVCSWSGGSRRPDVCGKSPKVLAFAVPMWERGRLLCRDALCAYGFCLGSR